MPLARGILGRIGLYGKMERFWVTEEWGQGRAKDDRGGDAVPKSMMGGLWIG